MEAEVTYIAKDGRRFADAIQCEEYERTIGIIPNTVADLLLTLGKHDEKEYVYGILLIRHKDGSGSIYTRFTGCCDDVLESFVNIRDLTEEQRYITDTVGELKEALRKLDGDDPVQYMIVYSLNIEFDSPGIMANHNPLVWKVNASNGK